MIRYCVRCYAPGRRARFIHKSQVYIVCVSLICELLKKDNPKFVLVVNNPYAACYRAALGKAQDMEPLKGKLSFQERLKICAQHWANSVRCALEDEAEDMLIVRFEDLLQEPEEMLRQICDHLELEFHADMLPQPGHRIPFGSRFRERWYPLNVDRALRYVEQISLEEAHIVAERCASIARVLGYTIPNGGEMS